MERSIDNQLEEVKAQLLEMGGFVEKALNKAVSAILRYDESAFSEVFRFEQCVNEKQITIDNLCLQILAKQGPVAKDLRLILSVIKINTDLERMGDQCVNMAYIARDNSRLSHQFKSELISTMCSLATDMVNQSLNCFVRLDAKAAAAILNIDDEVDELKRKVTEESIRSIKSDVNLTESCLYNILIARNLERLGDHATNIAEDVIFAFSGKDIRHGVS